jgi:hypothetical protein
MSLLHPSSTPAAIPELNLFTLPPTQTAVDNSYFLYSRPTSQVLGSNAPVEFCFGGEGPDYIDLSRSRLKVKLKLVHADATSSVLAADEVAVPANLALHSLWSQVDVTLGGRLMTPATGMYAYKSYIQTLLNYGKEAKKTQLLSQGWYPEQGKQMDVSTTAGNGAAFKKNPLFKESATVDLEGPLLEDVFQVNRYLLNNIEVVLKLYRTHPEFFVMSDTEDKKYKVVLEDVIFKVCMVRVSPGVILGHAKALESRNALYPYTRVDCKAYSVPTGARSINLDNVFQMSRPSRLVFGLVSANAFNGDYKKTPFKFQHYNISDVAVIVNGESVPGRPLETNFAADAKGRNYISGYLALFEGTGRGGSDFGNDLTPTDFADGYTLFVYNLDPEFKRGKYLNLVKRANVRLEIKFAKALTETVNIVIYAEHPNLYEVDEAHNIIVTQQ